MDQTAQSPALGLSTTNPNRLRLLQVAVWGVSVLCATWVVWGVGAGGSAMHADDWVFVARSQAARTFPAALSQTYSFCGLHRSLGFAGLTTCMAWTQADPAAFRLVVVATHALAAMALGWLALGWGASRAEAGLASLLFAVCPTGWNAVTWPATGYAPLAVAFSLFALAALTAALDPRASKRRRVGLWLAYAVLYMAAVLTYEAVCGVVLAAMLLAAVGKPAPVFAKARLSVRFGRIALAALPFVLVAAAIAATQPAHFKWQPRAGLDMMARTVLSVQYHLLDHLRFLDIAGWTREGVSEWSGNGLALAVVALLAVATGMLGWRAGRASDGQGSAAWRWRVFGGLALTEAFYAVYVLRGAMDTMSRHRYASTAGLALLAGALAVPLWRRCSTRPVWRAGAAAAGAVVVLTGAVLARGVTTRFDTGAVLESRMLERVVAELGDQRPEGLVILNRSAQARACRAPEDDMNAAGAGWVLEEYTRHVAGLPCLVLAGEIDVTTDGYVERRHPERRVSHAKAAVFVWDDRGVRRLVDGPATAGRTCRTRR